ncbi:MAG: hypothetical protein IKP00_14150 [Victivallales bacterium]|nr:hypothetical protein [Victivallales bacterium]
MKKKNFFILLLLSGVVVVVGLCILMTIMAHRRQKHTALYRQGEAAYKQGNYELARKKLSEYLWRDPNHENAWRYLAEIYETKRLWPDASYAWRHLVSLNVLNNDYVARCVRATYRAHNYKGLDRFFKTLPEEKRKEFSEIYALTQFWVKPNDEATEKALAAIPKDGATARLIQAITSQGPLSEFEALENNEDPVIQVEALIQDGYLSEQKEKNLERAEQAFRKAVSINPDLCRAELANFFFRQIRYKEANEVYRRIRNSMMSDNCFLNYAEVLFYFKDEEALHHVESEIPRKNRFAVPLRAYIQSLNAYLRKDSKTMVKNYNVAQQNRTTPMGLLLSYAVAVEDADIPLMMSVLAHWRRSKLYKEKLPEILVNVRAVIAKALKENKLDEASMLAQQFLRYEPPELICWRAVVLEQMAHKSLSMSTLQQASKLFPKELFFRNLALRLALSRGNREEALALYDQMIEMSDDPARDRYSKVLYLEREMQLDEAFQEIQKLLKTEHSMASGKHCLAFGIRTGNSEALRLASEFPELAQIARFETERRFGNLETATKMLKENFLEAGLSAEKSEDREILLPLGIYLALVREFERAKAIYNALLPFGGKDALIELNLSEIYSAEGDAKQALKYAADAYKKLPESLLVQTVYGLRYAEMEDYEQAATYIPDDTMDENAKAVLLTCLEKNIEIAFTQGRNATCRTIIKRLQSLQPDNPCAREYLEKLDAPAKQP